VKHVRIAFAVCAAVLVVSLAGCATFGVLVQQPPAAGTSKTPAKGDTGSITGRLEKNKNQYVLTDARTGIAYRFVGLGKDGEKQLAPWVGKTVTVRLEVISTESAKAVNARFVAIAQ